MIIAFSGKSRAGKTSAANYLVANYGFKKVSFAEELKEIAKSFYPFTQSELYGEFKDEKYKELDWTPREFLIRLGHFVRFHDTNYFVKAITGLPGSSNWVVDDLRFKNEAETLREKNATLIRIERYKKYLNNIVDASETELDDYKYFDYRINEVENRDLKSLHTKLDHLMDAIGIEKR